MPLWGVVSNNSLKHTKDKKNEKIIYFPFAYKLFLLLIGLWKRRGFFIHLLDSSMGFSLFLISFIRSRLAFL
jgi:hypothetical protein